MILQRSPNRWSCLIAAMAMAVEQPIDKIIELIGHDGSMEWSTELDEPECKISFHPAEIMDAALQLGYAVIYIEAMPQTIQGPPLYGQEKAEQRFIDHLYSSKGIILGSGNNHGHAVAQDHGMIYDPNGKIYSLHDANENHFNDMVAYMRFEKIYIKQT